MGSLYALVLFPVVPSIVSPGVRVHLRKVWPRRIPEQAHCSRAPAWKLAIRCLWIFRLETPSRLLYVCWRHGAGTMLSLTTVTSPRRSLSTRCSTKQGHSRSSRGERSMFYDLCEVVGLDGSVLPGRAFVASERSKLRAAHRVGTYWHDTVSLRLSRRGVTERGQYKFVQSSMHRKPESSADKAVWSKRVCVAKSE